MSPFTCLPTGVTTELQQKQLHDKGGTHKGQAVVIKLSLCPAPSPAFEEGGSERPARGQELHRLRNQTAVTFPIAPPAPPPGSRVQGESWGRLGRDPYVNATKGDFVNVRIGSYLFPRRIGSQLVPERREILFPQQIGAWVCVAGLILEGARKPTSASAAAKTWRLAFQFWSCHLQRPMSSFCGVAVSPAVHKGFQLGYSKSQSPDIKKDKTKRLSWVVVLGHTLEKPIRARAEVKERAAWASLGTCQGQEPVWRLRQEKGPYRCHRRLRLPRCASSIRRVSAFALLARMVRLGRRGSAPGCWDQAREALAPG